MTDMKSGSRSVLVPVALTCTALFSGCATVATPVTSSHTTAGNPSWVQMLGASDSTQIVELPTTNELRLHAVSAGKPYTAASGRTCRPLRNADAQLLLRLICREDDDAWHLTRSLNALLEDDEQPSTTMLVLASTEERMQGNDAAPPAAAASRRFPLAPGETLWSFTRRVTGDPLQWEIIADYNGIAQADSLKSGAILAVPVSLLESD